MTPELNPPQPQNGRAVTFSPCRTYRYTLRIVWDESLPVAAFVGLNPSTADEYQDDPTIRRCKGFAQSWGCGGMLMLNLFAFRATDPAEMKRAADPIGPDNRLAEFLDTCTGPRVACWGTHGSHAGRAAFIAPLLPELQCLGKNADGSPKHPLYLKADTALQPFYRGIK